MTSIVRRAAGFAGVGTLSLAAPLLRDAAAVPFALVAVVALVISEGAVFELFARPGDRRDGQLRGLAGFAFAATGIALLSSMLGLPVHVFVAAVVLVPYGNLCQQLARDYRPEPIVETAAFAAGGFVAAFAAQFVAVAVSAAADPTVPEMVFLAASGALLAALMRTVLFERDDPFVLVSVSLLLWLFADLSITVSPLDILVAIAITATFGYVSWALDTASIAGMLTGVFLSLLTIVLGGYAWFAVLIAFFGIGGLATKYKYGEKEAMGIAEANEGARGSGNVLGNAAVALVALIGFAASARLPIHADVFLFAFVGSIATAMSDTLSSEIGMVYDRPRLITTLERVEPGTDGGVTWQGELAGILGAALVALIALVLFESVDLFGMAVIVLAGVGGMTADSLFGATIEGSHVNNQGVNFLATLTGAVLGAFVALVVGLPG